MQLQESDCAIIKTIGQKVKRHMEKIRKYLTFTGRVQGVGFRYTAEYLAQSIGLTGWVRNEWDGSVAMEVQGTEEQIDLLIKKLRSGRFIRIDHVAELELPVKIETGFHVR